MQIGSDKALAEAVFGFTAGRELDPNMLKKDISGYSFVRWDGMCDAMPASDLTIYAYYQAVE